MDFSRQKLEHLKWIRRKDLIKINCFIIMSIFLIILLFMGFPLVAHADEPSTIPIPEGYSAFDDYFTVTSDNVWSSDSIDVNDYPEGFVNPCDYNNSDSFGIEFFDHDLSNGEIIIDDTAIRDYKCYVLNSAGTGWSQTGHLSFSSCKTYFLNYISTTNAFECFFIPDSCPFSLTFASNGPYLIDIGVYDNTVPYWNYSHQYIHLRAGLLSGYDNVWRIYNQQTNNNANAESSTRVNFGEKLSNNPITYENFLYYSKCSGLSTLFISNITNMYTIVPDERNGGTNISYSVTENDINYQKSDIAGEPHYPLIKADGGGNSITNHEKPYEGSCVYLQYSNLNTGNMHIVVKSDEFQKSQNASIKLKCYVSAQTQYNSSVGLQQSNVGVDGPFQNNFSTPDEIFDNGPYIEYEIPLSDFDNSGDYSISLEDINKGLWNSNEKSLYSFNSCFQNNSTGLATAVKTFFFSLLSVTNIIPDYSNMPNFLYSLNSEVWDVQGVFCIGDSEEIFDSFQLDMISGDIENQDYSLPNEDDIKDSLNTPTVPNNYVPQPYAPKYPDAYNVTVPNSNTDVDNDNSNNNTVNPTNNNDVTNGDYSPSVINNNNVTVTQGNKYPDKGVMQSFVRIINNDKNNTVNDLSTLTGANNYISLMNNALSVIPNEVWQVWLTALKAILGIVVSAFFLKILINWST